MISFLHAVTAFMVIVQFRGRLVRQYRACVVDSLGLGITCAVPPTIRISYGIALENMEYGESDLLYGF